MASCFLGWPSLPTIDFVSEDYRCGNIHGLVEKSSRFNLGIRHFSCTLAEYWVQDAGKNYALQMQAVYPII